ncbi:MAG: hypothetical protein JHC95_12845 [Solirubrobacteraceae bacterium]|nr:hypothetical protein [Solirubrobacteraceae bacterium]
MIASEELRKLAALRSEHGVLTLAARTDPRDPANATPDDPAWAIEVRNGLRTEGHTVESQGDHAAKVAFRALRERVERRLSGLDRAERGRSFVWVVADDPAFDHFETLQLPLDRSEVHWGPRAQVAPLAASVDLGAPAVAVLLGRDAVRLVRWIAGTTQEVTGGRFTEPPDERDLADSDVPDRRDAHVDSLHRRFLRDTARLVSARLGELGVTDIVLVGEAGVARTFAGDLPAQIQNCVLASIDANLHEESLGALDERLEPTILQARRDRVAATVQTAVDSAHPGGRGALGAKAVLDALGEGRVAHLVLDPQGVSPVNGEPPSVVGERAVELALGSGARVSILRVGECDALAQGGGIVAALRY